MTLEDRELFSARLPVKVLKTLNDWQSYILGKFRLTFLNRHMIVWFSWIFSICEIYGEYRKVTGHIATASNDAFKRYDSHNVTREQALCLGKG